MTASATSSVESQRTQTSTLVELGLEDPGWLDLVASARAATVFHRPAWARAVAEPYGYSATVLAVREGGLVTAGGPVVCVRRPGGRTLVSLPFTDHCPPLARDGASLNRLAADLAALSQREGVSVEVRGAVPAVDGWTNTVIGTQYLLNLEEGLEALRRRFSQTHRRRLRQAERSGLRVRFGRAADEMETFYRLHLRTRRRQGVPVQPRRFFEGVWRHVIEPGLGIVVLAETPAGRPAAAAVVLASNGVATVKFQASDPRCWDLRPNHLCYWAAIGWAAETGNRRFDFGRTEAGHLGLQRWKSGWGGAAQPLSYAVVGEGGPIVKGRGLRDWALREVIRRSPTLVCRTLGTLLYRYAA